MKTKDFSKIAGIVLTFCLAAVGGACAKKSVESNLAVEVQRVLNVYAWEEYLSEDMLDKFEKETGQTVKVTHYDNIDEMMQEVSSKPQNFDVLIVDNYSLEQLGNKRHLAPLDKVKLPNRLNIKKEYLNLPCDKGNKFSYPYMWGTTLVAYRTDMVSDPAETFALLADPALKGKIALLDERVDCYPFALRLIDEDQNTKDPLVIEKATQKLLELESQLEIKLLSDMEIKEALKEGTIAAALLYSGDAALIADECEDIDFFIPKEGATLWVDSFAISRDSSNLEEAHEFINFMMDAEVAAESSNFLWYATANEKAEEFLNQELRDQRSIYPDDEVVAKCRFQPENDNERERYMNEGWQRLKKANSARVKREMASTGTADH